MSSFREATPRHSVFVGHGLVKREHERLAGIVHRHEGSGHKRGRGRDVQDAARPPPEHLRQEQFGKLHQGRDVDLDEARFRKPVPSDKRDPIGNPRRNAQPRRSTLRHGFIVAQIALAMVPLTGAGLLGLSLERAMAVSPGFRPDHVLTGQISVPWNKYTNRPVRLAFNERLLKDLSPANREFRPPEWSTMCP